MNGVIDRARHEFRAVKLFDSTPESHEQAKHLVEVWRGLSSPERDRFVSALLDAKRLGATKPLYELFKGHPFELHLPHKALVTRQGWRQAIEALNRRPSREDQLG